MLKLLFQVQISKKLKIATKLRFYIFKIKNINSILNYFKLVILLTESVSRKVLVHKIYLFNGHPFWKFSASNI